MLKIGRFLLVLLLIFTSMGVTINKHFCGEILESIAINKKVDSCCNDTEMPKGCCHDVETDYDVDKHQISSFSFDLKAAELITQINYLDLELHCRALEMEQSALVQVYHSPPISESDLLIEIQTFRI
tara:strand:+ start:443 stop:823 length:381 start_codon:yes stop_codon:yes gene_type:complete